jgi:hypothetical protein
MKASTLLLTAILLCLTFVPQAEAQQRTLRVTITSDNAYMFGFGDVNAIDPATVAGVVFSRAASDIYGARIWDVQEHGGTLPPMNSSESYGPERYTLPGDIAGKYIYIVAWSDNAAWQGTIALFEDAETGFRVATGPDAPWEVYATGWNRDAGTREYPGLSDVNARIALANEKAGLKPGSIGWVNAQGCSDGTEGCRGILLHCTEFTQARIAGFPHITTSFGDGQFMWYRNPDYPDGSCDVETTPAALSGEYLIFRLGPIDGILPPARPCDSVALRLEASPEQPCCAQARISNVAVAPWYAVRLRILTGDIVFGEFQTRDGWTIDAGISGNEAVAHPPTESIPFCSDESFFTFCLSGADSIDARIEVTWIASDSALCRDTLHFACEKNTSTIDDAQRSIPSGFRILGCSPDPVRDLATITFSLDHAARVRFDIHDLLGRHRMTVSDFHREAGRHNTMFGTTDLPPGTYLLRMSAEGRRTTALFRVIK